MKRQSKNSGRNPFKMPGKMRPMQANPQEMRRQALVGLSRFK